MGEVLKEKDILRYIGQLCRDSVHELAYLAATSKIENFIRDKLAYLIFKHHKGDYHVARDFSLKLVGRLAKRPWTGGKRKVDIVVMHAKSKKPAMLIELKATNTDSTSDGEMDHATGHVKELFKQVKHLAGMRCPYLGIMMAVHPVRKLPENDEAIKYHKKSVSQEKRDHLLRCGYRQFLKKELPRAKPGQIFPLGRYGENGAEMKLIVNLVR